MYIFLRLLTSSLFFFSLFSSTFSCRILLPSPFPFLSPRPCLFGFLSPLPLLVPLSLAACLFSSHLNRALLRLPAICTSFAPFFFPPSPLSGPLLSPQSPTLHCLFVSLHSSPSVLIPSVSLTLISLIFLPLPLSFPFPSPPFFNHLNSFLILTIDPRVCHLARLSG